MNISWPRIESFGHMLDQSAEFCGGAGATSAPGLPVGQPVPEFAEAFALANGRQYLPGHKATGVCGSRKFRIASLHDVRFELLRAESMR